MRCVAALLALLLCVSTALAGGGHGIPYVAPTGSVSISVSTQPGPFPQSIAANNWTGFSSQTGSVFQQTNWGVTNGLYLQGNDATLPVAITTATPRDVEVTTFVRNGTIFLRVSNGTAVYCQHNGETTNGTFNMGIVTGLPANITTGSGALNGAYYALYSNANMNGAGIGYNNAATSGAVFKCGASGVDIYAQFSSNGGSTWTEFFRTKQLVAAVAGPVKLWAVTGYGYRDVTVTYLSTAALASIPTVGRWSPTDWGLKSGQTTGSITGGTNTLTLAASIGAATGDSIIVATGGESGAGAPGTVGVGGNSPVLSYANATAMNADTTQPVNTFAWTTNDGKAFFWNGSVWAQSGFYLTNNTAPRALLANVTNVAGGGLTLTLDTNANTTATSANVYINGYTPIFNVLNPAGPPVPANQIMALPSGTYALGAPFGTATPAMALASGATGWRILGQGIASTTLMSPDGTTSAGLVTSQSPYTKISNLKVVGNYRAKGFGLLWNGNLLSDYPVGISFSTNSDNSNADNVEVDDAIKESIQSSLSTNVTATNCVVSQSFVPVSGGTAVEAWPIEWANSTGGGVTNCTFTAPLLTFGPELFQSNGTVFSQLTVTNGLVSLNSAGGGFQINDIVLTLGANTQNPLIPATNPLINIDTNIGGNPGGVAQGGTFNRPKVIQQGLYDGSNVLQFVNIGSQNPNITIAGTYTSSSNGAGCFSAPNWATGMNPFLGIGVRNDGTGTVVSGMRFIGQVNTGSSKTNIYAEGGSLTSTNNIMDAFPIAGSGTVTSETGSETNATWNAANPGHPGC